MGRLGRLLAIALLAAPGWSVAQPADPFQWARPNPAAQSVANRPRPELDPLGVRVGAFRFFPSLELGATYEDNVFRSKRNTEGDIALTAGPDLRLESDWNNHGLTIQADAKGYAYATESSEDRADFGLEVSGRLDVRRDTRIDGGLGLRRRHESRVSPDTGGTKSPVQFDTATANLGAQHDFGRFNARVDGSVARLDYEDATQAVTGARINHDDRDRTVGRLAARGGYEPVEGTEAYVRLEGVASDYHDRVDDGGFARDSQGLDARVGLRMTGDGVKSGEVYIGFRGQYYENDGPARLNDDAVEALILGASANWNVTKLTTVTAGLDRGAFESTIAGSPGGVRTQAEIGADHELLRNLILSARFAGRYFEFEGVDREDFGLLLQFGARYLMNRHVHLFAGVERQRNRSSGAQQGVDNTNNSVMLRLTAQP